MTKLFLVLSALLLQTQRSSLSPAGMADVLECKAAWRPAAQGAWGRWRCWEPGCSGTRGVERGSGPSADQVVHVGAGQLWKKREQKRVQFTREIKPTE